ncbi:pentapeptide repeat-containing protein [Stakelama tenebrarum]|uniref:Pentapeptide repeat-containing protein n=1 Tax=Stakelama tenebrarum TaxID=2711215 RepID=A0A6G6Y7L6_9SPHN|nr:pentapeptide repeat-containing protein [Sphingosinithalassobacter tenebrarum]QIG80841.1 pentapeptide repeat-containing protein [Sphingosinithalassobacter tenebrarum]
MADSEDMKRLASGEIDLSRCDFREADLSGMDLSGRNFSYSLFEKARCEKTKFTNSNFQGAKVSFIRAPNANFDGCNLQRLHFGYSELSGSSMRAVRGAGARFQHAKLDGVDIRGSDFSSGNIDPDTNLSGIVVDDQTNFEGLGVLRPTSRNPVFADYEFDNGTLRRIDRERAISQHVEVSSVSGDGDPDLSGVGEYSAPASDGIVRFDHNDPHYLRVSKELGDAIDSLRTTNEHIENREDALQAMQYAKSLWERLELPLMTAKVGIVMAIDDALSLIGKASVGLVVAAAKAAVVDYIRKNLDL